MAQRPRSLDPASSAQAFFGATLRDWRVRRKLSQVQLGRLVHASDTLIARIEKAERRAFPDLIDRMDAALEAGGDLTRLASTLREDERATPVPLPEPVRTGPAQQAAHQEAMTGLMEALGGLRRMDHSLGSGAILATVAAQGRVAEHLLAGAPSSNARRGVLGLLGEIHQLQGWTEFDLQRVAAAEKSFATAKAFAEGADDPSLMAYVLGPSQGFVTTFAGHPGLGAQQCDLAVQWARRSGNRRLTAFVLTIGARAEARLGHAQRCLRMLDAAERELDQHDEWAADPVWLSVFDQAALQGHRGSCLLDLGRPADAIDPLREQDASASGVFVRNRTIWLLDRAAAHLALGDVDSACEGIDQAWRSAAGTSSQRLLRRLSSTVSSLEPWSVMPAVAELRERLRAVPTVAWQG